MSFVLINCLFKSIPHLNEVLCFFAMGLCEFALFHWYLWIIERMWHHKLLQNQPMEDTCKHNSPPIHISYFFLSTLLLFVLILEYLSLLYHWRSLEWSEFFKPVTFHAKGKGFPKPVIQVFQLSLLPAAYFRNVQPYLVSDVLRQR